MYIRMCGIKCIYVGNQKGGCFAAKHSKKLNFYLIKQGRKESFIKKPPYPAKQDKEVLLCIEIFPILRSDPIGLQQLPVVGYCKVIPNRTLWAVELPTFPTTKQTFLVFF